MAKPSARTASALGSRARGFATLAAVWRALRASRIGAPGLAARARALPRMAQDTLLGRYPGLSLRRLGLYALAVAYILSPIDLVPEAAFWFLGVVDDAALATWLTASLLLDTERYLAWTAGVGQRWTAAGRSAAAAHAAPGPSSGVVIPGEIVR